MAGGLHDAATLADLFVEFGPVRVRRMFGGAGVYTGSLMFALVADDALYLKADALTEDRFRAAGSSPFVYEAANGKRAVMSYWRVPDALYDDPAALADWARLAVAAAERSRRPAARRPRSRRSD